MKTLSLLILFVSILLSNSIDSTKRAITVTNKSSLNLAIDVSNTLKSFDTYIYKTTTSKEPLYVVYAVNIEPKDIDKQLSIIKQKFNFKYAYKTSNKKIKQLPINNFENNIFIPSKIRKIKIVSTKEKIIEPKLKQIATKMVHKKEVPIIKKTSAMDKYLSIHKYVPTKYEQLLLNSLSKKTPKKIIFNQPVLKPIAKSDKLIAISIINEKYKVNNSNTNTKGISFVLGTVSKNNRKYLEVILNDGAIISGNFEYKKDVYDNITLSMGGMLGYAMYHTKYTQGLLNSIAYGVNFNISFDNYELGFKHILFSSTEEQYDLKKSDMLLFRYKF